MISESSSGGKCRTHTCLSISLLEILVFRFILKLYVTRISSSRRRKVLSSASIHRPEIYQARSYDRSGVWCQNDRSRRKNYQIANLGHSNHALVDGTYPCSQAGQEAYISITRSYYKAAAGALVVYDITR